MKFGYFIEYNKKEVFFLKNHAESEAERLVSHFFFEESLYEVKESGLQLSFGIFRYPSTWHVIKTNCIKL